MGICIGVSIYDMSGAALWLVALSMKWLDRKPRGGSDRIFPSIPKDHGKKTDVVSDGAKHARLETFFETNSKMIIEVMEMKSKMLDLETILKDNMQEIERMKSPVSVSFEPNDEESPQP